MHVSLTQVVIVIQFLQAFGRENSYYVDAQISQDMLDKGKAQYQFLQTQSQLPQYGSCWKSAIQQIEDDCKHLSEETQSDMALSITNCFLESAGHQTYNCELNKKPNLRGICIMNMSDRAFGVYTEFYTHVMNICWFLRGQIWHEIITQNTYKVGKQMEESALQQQEILTSQRESLKIQQQVVEHGERLEKVLERFYEASQQHQEALSLMSQSMGALQSWMMGELAWFDATVFYVTCAVFMAIFTSGVGAVEARLPILILFVASLILEKSVWWWASGDGGKEMAAYEAHATAHGIIWWIRRVLVVLSIIIIFYKSFLYRNLNQVNNRLLREIFQQNTAILERVSQLKTSLDNTENNNNNNINKNGRFSSSVAYENDNFVASMLPKINHHESSHILNGFCKSTLLLGDESRSTSNASSVRSRSETPINRSLSDKDKNLVNKLLNVDAMRTPGSRRYNLRSSRPNTPEIRLSSTIC